MKINNAYIDGTNLYKGIKDLGENLDYKRFKKWLIDKYKINIAYIFIGYIKEQQPLYDFLENCGFKLIFRESISHKGVLKGNADAELILKSVRDVFEKDIDNAIIISGDGDFACLIDFLVEKNVFKTIIIPNKKYSSYLIRKKQVSTVYLEDCLHLFKSEKTPNRD